MFFGVSKVPRASSPSLRTFSSNQTHSDGAAAVMNPICATVCENWGRLFHCKFSAGDARSSACWVQTFIIRSFHCRFHRTRYARLVLRRRSRSLFPSAKATICSDPRDRIWHYPPESENPLSSSPNVRRTCQSKPAPWREGGGWRSWECRAAATFWKKA